MDVSQLANPASSQLERRTMLSPRLKLPVKVPEVPTWNAGDGRYQMSLNGSDRLGDGTVSASERQ